MAKTGRAADCEDALMANAAYAAVIDGATSVGRLSSGKTWGRAAAEVCVSALMGIPGDATAFEAVACLTHALAETTPKGCKDGPSASVVIFSAARREVWRVGDTSFALDGHPYPPNPKKIDNLLADVRAATLDSHRMQGVSDESLQSRDLGRELISPVLQRTHVFRNHPGEWGFGAVSARATPRRFIHIVPLMQGTCEVVLCSDGYPHPWPNLRAAEHDLSTKLAADPLCISALRSTKGVVTGARSFDDRAYLRLAV